MKSLKLYTTIDVRKLTPKIIFQIRKLSDNVFRDVFEHNYTCNIIKKFNEEIKKHEFEEMKDTVFCSDFTIPLFDDLDNKELTTAVCGLFWNTSYRLFTEVFSEKSKYMTVHQAKGLEWDKVIVSVNPSKPDKALISDLYSSPQLMEETPANEFTRIYYVACSRAKEDLYIHISDIKLMDKIQAAVCKFINETGNNFDYEFIQ